MTITAESKEIFFKELEKRGLSMYQVTKHTGITQTTFHKWKKKPQIVPKYETMLLIAKYLEVPIDFFYCEEKGE